jgi:hypothetical protein
MSKRPAIVLGGLLITVSGAAAFAGSLCRERPEAGTTDRHAGDGNAGGRHDESSVRFPPGISPTPGTISYADIPCPVLAFYSP